MSRTYLCYDCEQRKDYVLVCGLFSQQGSRYSLIKTNYNKLMKFLSTSQICCSVNPDAEVFCKRICWDCFKKIRREVTSIVAEWALDYYNIAAMIKWRNK